MFLRCTRRVKDGKAQGVEKTWAAETSHETLVASWSEGRIMNGRSGSKREPAGVK